MSIHYLENPTVQQCMMLLDNGAQLAGPSGDTYDILFYRDHNFYVCSWHSTITGITKKQFPATERGFIDMMVYTLFEGSFWSKYSQEVINEQKRTLS